MSDTIDCPRCEHEHEPLGCYEELKGEQECEECGFKFDVEIEYDPVFITTCIDHEWGDFTDFTMRDGSVVNCRFCKHCQKCELAPDNEKQEKPSAQ